MAEIAHVDINHETGFAVAHTEYRPDIDGLRAVAVLSVLTYHVGFAWIPGGFVGVDIFFVISGYLISAIIEREIVSNRFSLAGFYARRICRILPAFVAMAVVISLLAYRYLFPVELENYAGSLVAAALSVSNVYFWSETGYFDAAAATKPLIHTWSLAVEEQFYALLPLYLIIAHKLFPALRRLGILLLLGASLSLSGCLVFSHPNATFYLLHTRAWELLLGTILSYPRLSIPMRRGTREILSLAGAGMIVIAVFGFSVATPFPGAAAFLPCVGAALIIASGQGGPTIVAAVLSMRPAVFIGRISYSLYLWHWPVIVFQHQYAFLIPDRNFATSSHPFLMRNVIIMVAAVIAATVSWRFVEQPFRLGYRTRSKFRVLVYGLSATALLACAGVLVLQQNGFSNRFSPEAIRFASYLGYGQEHLRPGECFILSPYHASDFDKAKCLGEHAGKKAYLIIGDSLAAHLWYGLSHSLGDADVLQATGAGCMPVRDQAFGAYPECAKVISYVLGTFLANHPVNLVILSARWGASDLPRLAGTLAWFKEHGIRTVVLGPMVEYTSALPRLLALSVELGDPEFPERQLIHQAALDADVARVAAAGGANYVSMYNLLCQQGACLTVLPGGIPLEFDGDHFTREGSIVAAQRLTESNALR